MGKNVVYDSPNISQRRNDKRVETAPVLVDEEEEEAPVVSEQHEVPDHLLQYSTVQYSTVQYRTVQYSTVGASPYQLSQDLYRGQCSSMPSYYCY